ncbi:MAG: aryl-sulfate sulfotransferase [bacterium]
MTNRRAARGTRQAGRCLLLAGVLAAALSPGLARAQAFDGLTLYNSLYSRTTRLVANDGQTVNSWTCATNIAYMPYLMPDSTLWRPGVYSGASMRGGVYGGLIERYNWDGDIIQNFLWSGPNHQQHHDIEPMPNGNVLVLAWERKTQTEARAMGRVNISSEMWPETIIEYDPDADSVVWEWRIWDHLIQDVDSTKPNFGVVRDHPERVDINIGTLYSYGDWIHANIVSYSPERDEIIFSSRFQNEFYVIDHSTTTEEARGSTGGRHGRGGDIIYRWGNPQNYRRGGPADQHFFVVHGAHWIAPGLRGAGNILVFHNGDRPGSSNDYSSAEEITPPLDHDDHYYIHPDSAFGPAGPGWIYSNPGVLYSANMSGAFRLPNDNTVICEAVTGRVTEVTYDGDVVWQYNAGAWTGRAMKYPRDFTVGTQEPVPPSPPDPLAFLPAIARGSLLVGPVTGGTVPEFALHDASGRRVLALRPGANSVAHLAPGVYYARAAGTPARRVVLAR